MVETEGLAAIELGKRAGRAHHVAAHGVGQLECGGADAGAHGVDQQRLPRSERGLGDHGVVGGDEHLGHAAGGHEVERLGDGRALPRRYRQQLRLPATPGDAEHPCSDPRAW